MRRIGYSEVLHRALYPNTHRNGNQKKKKKNYVNVFPTLEHSYTHGVEYFIMYNCSNNPKIGRAHV